MFVDHLKAGFSVLMIETQEESRAMQHFGNIAKDAGYSIHSWDLVKGFKSDTIHEKIENPAEALNRLSGLPDKSVVFMLDFHKFLESVQVFRMLKNTIPSLKGASKHIVFISPVVNLPVEVEKDITVLDFDLPSANQLIELAEGIVKDNALEFPVNREDIGSAKGLTMDEAENTLSLSVIQHGKYNRASIEDHKLQTIKKSGLLELINPKPLDQLGGLDLLKKYVENRKEGYRKDDLPEPKGILLVGPPGTGKSLASTVIASVLSFPLVNFSLSAMKGGIVGETQKNMKKATKIIDALYGSVVRMDEIEKALAGAQGGGRGDSGVGTEQFGFLLSWMEESLSPKFIVGTANDLEAIMSMSQGALLRRFDDIFFVDLPTHEGKEEILRIMINKYDPCCQEKEIRNVTDAYVPRMDNWSGAEIEKFVKAAMFDGLESAFANTKTVYSMNSSNIEAAREWARKNCRMASSESKHTEGRRLNVC